jgi:hypothetical protein
MLDNLVVKMLSYFSTDALLKLGAMMKQGAGVWTDGYVAHPTNTKYVQ